MIRTAGRPGARAAHRPGLRLQESGALTASRLMVERRPMRACGECARMAPPLAPDTGPDCSLGRLVTIGVQSTTCRPEEVGGAARPSHPRPLWMAPAKSPLKRCICSRDPVKHRRAQELPRSALEALGSSAARSSASRVEGAALVSALGTARRGSRAMARITGAAHSVRPYDSAYEELIARAGDEIVAPPEAARPRVPSKSRSECSRPRGDGGLR
jgi:hypothetical protein